jgi:hypothetical protein
MINNRVIIKAGLSNDKPENKYRLGKAIREASEGSLKGYIVLLGGKEQFFYSEQVTFLRSYKRQVNEFMEMLLTLEKVGLPTEEIFKACVEFQEEL